MDDRNDGFYHGYDETDWRERPDNTPDADEQARRKAEYEAKVGALMGEYYSEHPRSRRPGRTEPDPAPRQTSSYGSTDQRQREYQAKVDMLMGQYNAERKRRDSRVSYSRGRSSFSHGFGFGYGSRNSNSVDDMDFELTEAKKAELLAKADQIRYNRSMGSGYSNGGSSPTDFVGSGAPQVNNPRQQEPMFYGQQPLTPENTFMPQNTWDSRDEEKTNGSGYNTSRDRDYDWDSQENRYGSDVSDSDPYGYEDYGRSRTSSNRKVATKEDGKRRYRRSILLGILILIVGMIVVSMAIRIRISDSAFFDKAMSVQGQITGSRAISSRRASINRDHRLYYSFTLPDGQTYKGSDVVESSRMGSIGLSDSSGAGSIVTVYYDPDNPSSSRLISKDVTISYVMGLFSIMASAYLIFRGYRDRNRFANGQYYVVEENGKKKFELIK